MVGVKPAGGRSSHAGRGFRGGRMLAAGGEWKPEGILTTLGDWASYQAIHEGRGFQAIESLWQAELEEFRRIRLRYLIYDRHSE